MVGIHPNTKVRDLTEEEIVRLREAIDRDVTVEGDLRRERRRTSSVSWTTAVIEASVTAAACPSTDSGRKTNARSRKGPKKTVGGKRKK